MQGITQTLEIVTLSWLTAAAVGVSDDRFSGEAAALGYQFMLSGHTHGGQFCLPGSFPILRNAPVLRSMLMGPWQHGDLQGYTSPGAGGSGVAARFFCPPEITVHILRAGGSPLPNG